MLLFSLGVNHKTAPVAIRERVSFPPDRLGDALYDLVHTAPVDEALILSTCNRTEVYCELPGASGEAALDWFGRYHQLRREEVGPHLYTYDGSGTVRHLLRVASGLDSMVLGEPQILGQVKDAFRRAQRAGTVGKFLGRLFQHSFAVAKQVRTDTAIGASPVSVAFAAVRLAQQIFTDLGEQTALLIGAGETIELAARHLRQNGVGRLIVANRTVENALRLARDLGGYAIGLADIGQHLAEADLVISSTASPTPILDRATVQQAVRARRHRPVLMVDIAVPRDIDPAVASLEDVYLYTVDDLEAVIEENRRSRRQAADEAEEIIDTEVSHFMGWLQAQEAVPAICEYRTAAEGIRDEVLARTRRLLARGADPEQAIQFLARTLTNKLAHVPCSQLRRAGSEGRREVLAAAREILGLSALDRDR
jgi:glutamyl-tRNA reductase